jgi:uridine kinase
MNPISRVEMLFAEEWLAKSSYAVLSHWVDDGTFLRHSFSKSRPLYTSATLHSIIALNNIGFWKGDGRSEKIKTSSVEISVGPNIPTAGQLLEKITNLDQGSTNWVETILMNSIHVPDSSHLDDPRTAIVLELLITAWVNLIKNADLQERYRSHTAELIDTSKNLLSKYLKNFKCRPGETPAPIVNLANCVLALEELTNCSEFGSEMLELHALLDGHVNYHMARSASKSIMSFDPVSLATAISGMVRLKQEPVDELFFLSCLEVIMSSQRENGCWDDGISIAYSGTGDVVQQPSVGVAVSVAEAAISTSFLTDFDDNIDKILQTVLPGLRRVGLYLSETFQKIKGSKIEGWASDRTRKMQTTEAWITSLANRFFYRLWIAEKAVLRHRSLAKLGLRYHRSNSLLLKTKELWEKQIIEPDSLLKPVETVWEKFVSPLISQMDSGNIICEPSKNGVSFIVYGPPGSGKTFFVENIAKTLDWPLVEINPGHFISSGLELIEATSKEIFDLLYNINHAVVFFDECDELFRNRDSKPESARSILSFATASMLPKLQKLHDSRNVIFVLGTNYLSNMDAAIIRPGRFDEIVFFDRPDDLARERLISKKYKDPQEISEFVNGTKFFAFQELFPYCSNPSQFENSVTDYKKWCDKLGKTELAASRLTEEQRNKTMAKWND